MNPPARPLPGRCRDPDALHFEVLNLRGAQCLQRIVTALQELAPGLEVYVDLVAGRVSVASTLTARDVETALSSLGYPAYRDPPLSR
ncbi:heavy-metal-associated domain-containing protein [Arenimonas donghaensis]|uniref:Uncharacterized protein n=1 Tax=Arenimonas donghaensis DSM 18148 = HO3-R19 TaxID=1121014 RepID=A0A087MM10_9GAMM|nr:hypothetical protein [Arenimonas donghaensis]KFL37913.1 hypothetical protein N788_01710 [Arenimonas donghaensis DSM 18148 = HO3-R19]